MIKDVLQKPRDIQKLPGYLSEKLPAVDIAPAQKAFIEITEKGRTRLQKNVDSVVAFWKEQPRERQLALTLVAMSVGIAVTFSIAVALISRLLTKKD